MRKLRSAVMLGLVWAAAWTPIGVLVAMRAIRHATREDAGRELQTLLYFGRNWFLGGAVSGFIFALVLPLLTRKSRIEDLSHRYVAALGALGTVVGFVVLLIALGEYPDLSGLSSVIRPAAVFLALGALSASATLRFARRSPAESAARQPND